MDSVYDSRMVERQIYLQNKYPICNAYHHIIDATEKG